MSSKTPPGKRLLVFIGRLSVKIPNLDNLRIVYYPDPVLKKVADEVVTFDQNLNALAHKMIDLMHGAKGVGLAAPQVGVSLRLFVCNPTGEEGDDRIIVNPKFVDLTGAAELEEGCLSLPGVTVNMRRATTVNMEAFDVEGHPIEMTAQDLTARIWQHETDHLDGRLIIDRMSESDEIQNRRAIRQLRDDYAKK